MDPSEKKAELFYDYGTTALNKGDYTKALVNLKKAIEIIDDDSRFHNNLSMAYYFKKKFKLAIKHLKISINLDPKNSDALNNLGSVYFYMGEISKAKEIYTKVLTDLEYNKQFRVYYNLALISLREGRKNKAISLLQKAIKENKSYCPAQYKLGMIYYNDHKYHQSMNHFENASLGSCSNSPSPHYYMALSQKSLQKYSDAVIKFEEVQNKFPKSPEAKLASRQINKIKIEEFRKNKNQELKYQLQKFENKIRSKLPVAKATEGTETPPQSVDF